MWCDFASWMCHSVNGNGGIHWQKASNSCWGGWMRSVMCAFWNCCSCCSGNSSGTVICWNVSHVWDHNRWSVMCPFGCGYIDALNEICLGGMVFLRGESCWGSPVQIGQINHSCNTVHWGSGGQNDLFVHKQSTYHLWTSYWLCRVSVCGCLLLCCINFYNQSDDFSQSLRILFIYFSCNGVCILKSFNKNADCHSVTVKSALLSCCFGVVDIGSRSFIILLLYLNKAWSISMNICITEF